MEKIELGLSFSIKVVNEKSRGEVSLMEQDTIENKKNNVFFKISLVLLIGPFLIRTD